MKKAKMPMRWPLRNQIFVRMLLVLIVAIAAITYANIQTAFAGNRKNEQDSIKRIVKLVRETSFPLSTSVLENIKSISGADFLVISEHGSIIAKTNLVADQAFIESVLKPKRVTESVQIGDLYFYHAMLGGPEIRFSNKEGTQLHILLPRQSDGSVWWQASRTPLLIACFALPFVFLVSFALSSQVTRPLAKLENQVKRIAEGDLQMISAISGNNEIRDLGSSINEMAARLKDHEVQLRKNERLDTLVQFGRSIAHHLRNSATGCRMAVELLASQQKEVGESQNYQVSIRQLDLMDRYIKRFLLLSKSPDDRIDQNAESIELGSVLDDVVYLLKPSVEHLAVDLAVNKDCDGSEVFISRDDAEQLMMNLIRNAISAASEDTIASGNKSNPAVSVELKTKRGDFVFSVADNGAGPDAEIADDLFQPFVTGSSEGTGLGLSLVQQIADSIGGSVRWERNNDQTVFVFESK